MHSLFSGDFNLAVWRFFVHPPNLANVKNSFIAIICIAATAFRQIKVMLTMITDQFAINLLTQQFFEL